MQTQENELQNALNTQEVNAAEQQAQTQTCECEKNNTENCVDEKDQQIEALKQELEALKAQSAQEKDVLMRTIAEAQNAKRMALADIEKEKKYGIEKFVKALIPVVDSLDMALSMTNREDPATKATIDGVENTLNLFLKELKSFGVERLDPVGEAFDPNFHQAISMVPTDEVKPNCVLSVMQKGFVLNGRVVRPAMVMIAKALPQNNEEQTINIKA